VVFGTMAHAAAHLKKARELEQPPEIKALAKAREKRRRHRERAERRRKVLMLTNREQQYLTSMQAQIQLTY